MINCTNKSSASQYKNIFEKVLTEGFLGILQMTIQGLNYLYWERLHELTSKPPSGDCYLSK